MKDRLTSSELKFFILFLFFLFFFLYFFGQREMERAELSHWYHVRYLMEKALLHIFFPLRAGVYPSPREMRPHSHGASFWSAPGVRAFTLHLEWGLCGRIEKELSPDPLMGRVAWTSGSRVRPGLISQCCQLLTVSPWASPNWVFSSIKLERRYPPQELLLVWALGGRSWLSIRLLISAQIMISQFMSSSRTSDSALMVQSPLGILSLSPPLSAPPLLVCSLCLSLSLFQKINKWINK